MKFYFIFKAEMMKRRHQKETLQTKLIHRSRVFQNAKEVYTTLFSRKVIFHNLNFSATSACYREKTARILLSMYKLQVVFLLTRNRSLARGDSNRRR